MLGNAAPAFGAARGVFVEPYSPHEVIGVMHLAGRGQKTHVFRLDRLDGGAVETSLRDSACRALREQSVMAGALPPTRSTSRLRERNQRYRPPPLAFSASRPAAPSIVCGPV
jgi:hypothetical protein